MNNYYNELSQLSILEQEINRFATSLQNKKAGCFIHRFEELLNVLPNEFRNQVNFRNKIQDYIKKSNYEKDVKDYVLQVFLSFFEPIEIKVPNSLKNVVEENESYNKAMIEGYLNFEKAMIEHHKEISYTSPPETDKPDEVTKELHNHIFKGNAFEVFEKYHNNKSLAENSRTDLNLLFQLFKNDNLFVETVELKHYIQWLNKTYGYGLTELKKVDINSRPNIQRTNDYKEYKRTTLK
ncbi:hypothetical protein [Moheibacter stercoris]|uniref:DNA phosphorothioation-dependent restriction protein DptG n=1 Tax=Moheibacter stercoris TaxID=1628251 RepID=A0ABV2LQ53_9FLAO